MPFLDKYFLAPAKAFFTIYWLPGHYGPQMLLLLAALQKHW